MVKKGISSIKNRKEVLWETALCSGSSSHSVTAIPSRSRSLRLFLWNMQSDIWKPILAYGEKGNILIKNWKEALWDTAVCSVNTSHRVTHFPSRSLSLRLVLWNLQSDIWKPIEGYGEKRSIFLKHRIEDFWETALCSVNWSHSVTAFPSRSVSLRLFLWNLQSDIWNPIDGYGENGNILR